MDQKFKPGLCSFKAWALKIYFKLLWGWGSTCAERGLLWQFQRRRTEEVLGPLGKVLNLAWEVSWKEVRKTGRAGRKRKSYPTFCNPMDYTVHGILQAVILEWVAVPFSRWSFQPRNWTQVSSIAGGFFTNWATREAQGEVSGKEGREIGREGRRSLKNYDKEFKYCTENYGGKWKDEPFLRLLLQIYSGRTGVGHGWNTESR